MRALALSLLVGCACISDGDAQTALDGYCGVNEGKSCQADGDCCPSFECVLAVCRHLVPGTCLFADGGSVEDKGAWCGCTGDCKMGTCGGDSKCQ